MEVVAIRTLHAILVWLIQNELLGLTQVFAWADKSQPTTQLPCGTEAAGTTAARLPLQLNYVGIFCISSTPFFRIPSQDLSKKSLQSSMAYSSAASLSSWENLSDTEPCTLQNETRDASTQTAQQGTSPRNAKSENTEQTSSPEGLILFIITVIVLSVVTGLAGLILNIDREQAGHEQKAVPTANKMRKWVLWNPQLPNGKKQEQRRSVARVHDGEGNIDSGKAQHDT